MWKETLKRKYEEKTDERDKSRRVHTGREEHRHQRDERQETELRQERTEVKRSASRRV